MASGNDDVLNEKSDNNYKEFTEEDPLKENVANKKVKRQFFQTCLFVVENVTVEPSICLFIVGALMTVLTSQNLYLEKACRVNLNYSDEICTSLKTQEISNQNEYEKNAQVLLASALAWKTYLSATIPCIIALFVGSWSDMTGHRKIFMIIPTIGQFLICINNMINVYFFNELRLEILVFSEAILEGFIGGWCVCFLSAFAYIGALTTVETRTFRIGLINFCLTVGFPIGMGLSGVFLKNYGYYGSYGLAASLHFLNIVYNVFILKDPKRSEEQKKHDGKGVLYFIRSFFDLRNVNDTLSVVFKKAPSNRRMRLIILLCTISILFGPFQGKMNSIIGLAESLIPLMSVPLYTKIYVATMEVLPGAAFLVGAVMSLPAVVVFSWLLYEYRKGLSKAKIEAAVE